MYQLIIDFLGIQDMHVDPNLVVVFAGLGFIVILCCIYDFFMLLFRYIFVGRR